MCVCVCVYVYVCVYVCVRACVRVSARAGVCVVRVLIQRVYCTCILCIVDVCHCKALWALVRKGALEMSAIIIIIIIIINWPVTPLSLTPTASSAWLVWQCVQPRSERDGPWPTAGREGLTAGPLTPPSGTSSTCCSWPPAPRPTRKSSTASRRRCATRTCAMAIHSGVRHRKATPAGRLMKQHTVTHGKSWKNKGRPSGTYNPECSVVV